MRYTMLTVILVAATASVGSQPYNSPVPPQQAAMTCGNGVIIRADGAVMVDEWKFYDSTPGTAFPNKLMPTSITVGKSLKDPVNLCFEFANGTICGDIGKVRALIEKSFPTAGTAK